MTTRTVEFTCPGCRQQVELAVPVRRHADEFHRPREIECDFPLFWARPAEFPAGLTADPVSDGLAEGPETPPTVAAEPEPAAAPTVECWSCHAPSPAAAHFCGACGSPLVAPTPGLHWVVWLLMAILIAALAVGAVWGLAVLLA